MRRRRWRAAHVARNAPTTSRRQTGASRQSAAWTSRSAEPSSAASVCCHSAGLPLASRHAVPVGHVPRRGDAQFRKNFGVKEALNEKTLGAIEAMSEELDDMLADQKRWK